MKVKDVLETLDNINEVRQVLYSASEEEGTHVTPDIVELIQKLINSYEADILQFDVIKRY